jgi:hypothetical protein
MTGIPLDSGIATIISTSESGAIIVGRVEGWGVRMGWGIYSYVYSFMNILR